MFKHIPFKPMCLTVMLTGISMVSFAGVLDGLTVKLGASVLAPTGESKQLNLKATSNINLTPSLDYRIGQTPFSVEVLLALPFNQKVNTIGGSEAASLKHLPPTITAKYNLPSIDGFSPYAGVGVTAFIPWGEKLKGAPNVNLKASTEIAPALQIGATFKPQGAKNWGVYADIRYAHLSTDIKANGSKLGSLDINPMVYTVGYSFTY